MILQVLYDFLYCRGALESPNKMPNAVSIDGGRRCARRNGNSIALSYGIYIQVIYSFSIGHAFLDTCPCSLPGLDTLTINEFVHFLAVYHLRYA